MLTKEECKEWCCFISKSVFASLGCWYFELVILYFPGWLLINEYGQLYTKYQFDKNTPIFFVKNTIGVLLLFVKMAVSLRNLVSGVGLQLFTINVYTRKC